MGMAASQARLLSITARIHDVEYQAQSIQNAKVQLATQSDQVYNDYMEALDAQTLTISTIGADGSKARITANFNNLFSSNRVRPADGSIYALRNEQGKLVVENDVYNAYESFNGQDAYAFATYMLGGEASLDANASDFDNYTNNIHKKEEAVYQKNKDNTDKIAKDSTIDTLRKALEDYVSDGDIYSGNLKPEYDTEEGREKYEGTLQNYREAMYKQFGEDICTDLIQTDIGNDASMTEAQYNQDRFNNYVDIFNQIKMCGGCVPISDYNGLFGDASNNSEWLTSMIQCGKFTIDTFSKDKNGKMSMMTTSPSSDSCLSYTEVTSIDSTAVKKAEAKYEKDLKEIDKKDKRYDLTLSKLETERTALTTEYDSVKKVIEDNIDRTFGIFS
ncbi:MAG: hypothetical protein NC408_06650 [Candidatus Gastranaerophilales bacterium]|nr:hypothetical protein [Candidatus Gastranaerophilales bacterium]MCM1072791.1 hypothetical protein [Bacteroides sp.]